MLSDFRDRFLLTNKMGTALVSFYCKHSPLLVKFVAEDGSLRALLRWALMPVVCLSWLALNIGLIPTLVLILFSLAAMCAAMPRLYRKWRLYA